MTELKDSFAGMFFLRSWIKFCAFFELEMFFWASEESEEEKSFQESFSDEKCDSRKQIWIITAH